MRTVYQQVTGYALPDRAEPLAKVGWRIHGDLWEDVLVSLYQEVRTVNNLLIAVLLVGEGREHESRPYRASGNGMESVGDVLARIQNSHPRA
jgi:hypothetical protein